ncbi:hypothetical protein L2E82_47815 [Cichorium intybus]|uniref:Uncharacterized protein n=1 Tax=Cichorium intybus TaxID=13427 RepID=A0ACB8Z0P7_CICIN|nr:hypothetical protein L2E82_47815 [Cichorium intybus]
MLKLRKRSSKEEFDDEYTKGLFFIKENISKILNEDAKKSRKFELFFKTDKNLRRSNRVAEIYFCRFTVKKHRKFSPFSLGLLYSPGFGNLLTRFPFLIQHILARFLLLET